MSLFIFGGVRLAAASSILVPTAVRRPRIAVGVAVVFIGWRLRRRRHHRVRHRVRRHRLSLQRQGQTIPQMSRHPKLRQRATHAVAAGHSPETES